MDPNDPDDPNDPRDPRAPPPDDSLPPLIQPDYLLPGTTIDKYVVNYKLGKGGNGCCYSVSLGGHEFALKILLAHEDAERRANQQERMAQEYSLLKLITHPNVVKVRAHETWGDPFSGYPYIVMPIVDGRDVYDWQYRSRASLRQIIKAMRSIADALDHMHKRGVFHRDIKSTNILVKADGVPVLIDFGIARTRMARTLTKAQQVVGTISHFSPEYCLWNSSDEHAQGEQYPYGAQGDYYALGFMLFELLAGATPFKLSEQGAQFRGTIADSEMLSAIVNQEPLTPSSINPAIPPAMDELLLEMLLKDPNQRLVGAKLMARLDDLLLETDAEWDKPFEVPLRDQKMALRPRGSPRAQPVLFADLGSPSRSPARGTPVFSEAPPPPSVDQPRKPPEQAKPDTRVERRTPGRQAVALPVSAEGPSPQVPARPAHHDQVTDVVPEYTATRTPPRQLATEVLPAVGNQKPTELVASIPKGQRIDELSTERGAIYDQRPTDKTLEPLQVPPGLQAALADPARRRFSPLQVALAVVVTLLVGLWVTAKFVVTPSPSAGVSLTHELDDQNALSPKVIIKAAPQGSRLPPPAPAPTGQGATGPSEPHTMVTPDVGALIAATGAVAASPSSVTATSAVAPVALAAVTTTPTTSISSPSQSRRSASDQADVDRILADRYGRPRVPGPAKPAAPKPADDSPFAPVVVLDTKVASADTTLGVGTGRHIHVRLRTPLDSRTIGDGPVEFEVTSAVEGRGSGAIPATTLGYGRASTSTGRFTLAATLLKLPSGQEVAFSGTAYDRKDGKPGLPAGRQITPAQNGGGDSLATQVAKTSANTALEVVTGGVGQDVARNSATTVINGSSAPSGGSGQTILLLDAPYDFDLMVQKPF